MKQTDQQGPGGRRRGPLAAAIAVALLVFSWPAASVAGGQVTVRSGYGRFGYSEKTSAFGSTVSSESESPIYLLEGVGRIDLPRGLFLQGSLGVGRTGEDRETWRNDGVVAQTNELQVDLFTAEGRFGVRWQSEPEGRSWDLFAALGYDALTFARDDFVVNGVPQPLAEVTEDFRLPRGGLGVVLTLPRGRWSLEGEATVDWYLEARVENSALPGITFDTEGYRWDLDLRAGYQLSAAVLLGAGVSYTAIELEQSGIEAGTVFPDSSTGILALHLNLDLAL